jgi:hypothetical protein
MTKARDLSNLISGGSISNDYISLDAAEIPNLDTSKITTGNFDASRIGSGTLADARISASSVSQHATSFDDNKIVNDISTLALRQASDQNKSAYNTNSQFVDVFQDATGIDTTTNASRDINEYVSSIVLVTDTNLVDTFDLSSQTIGTPTQFLNGLNNELRLNIYPSYNLAIEAGNPFSGNCLRTGGASGPSWNASDGGTYVQWLSTSTETFAQNGAFTVEFWLKPVNTGYTSFSNTYALAVGSGTNMITIGPDGGSSTGIYLGSNFDPSFTSGTGTGWSAFSTSTWSHVAIVRDASGNIAYFKDGVRQRYGTGNSTNFNETNFSGNGSSSVTLARWGFYYTDQKGAYIYMDQLRFSKNARYDPTQSTYNIPTEKFTTQVPSVGVTGNFTGTTITAPSSVSSMGAIITYQDNAGTNALNTDIVLELSADNGSNWSTATLSALPNFSTGIKMAKVNDLAVTAGTQLKYRINFANQASGSKEARIRGVALQY